MTYQEFLDHLEVEARYMAPARSICLECNNYENRCECAERAQLTDNTED